MESPFVLMLLLQVHTCCPRLWHQLTVFEVAKSLSEYSTSSSSITTIGLQQTRAIVVCRGLRTYGFSDLVALFPGIVCWLFVVQMVDAKERSMFYCSIPNRERWVFWFVGVLVATEKCGIW
jgi:hypothetical protein